MMSIWLLAAEWSNVRFDDIADPVHPASRLHGQALETDIAGPAFDSGGQGRHAVGTLRSASPT